DFPARDQSLVKRHPVPAPLQLAGEGHHRIEVTRQVRAEDSEMRHGRPPVRDSLLAPGEETNSPRFARQKAGLWQAARLPDSREAIWTGPTSLRRAAYRSPGQLHPCAAAGP